MTETGESLQVLERESDSVSAKIKAVEEEMQSLARQKDEAIKRGDDAAAIKARRDLKPLADQLEELQIKKEALDSRLGICKGKIDVAKAAAIRSRIVEEAWPRGVKAYAALQRRIVEINVAIRELMEADQLLQQLTKEHYDLIGEYIKVENIGLPIDWIRGVQQMLDELRLPPVENLKLTDPKLQAVKR